MTRRFGKKQAVSDLSFEVARGEVVAVVGPNGAGKSTTFLCLAGLLRPDAGTIAFEGAALDAKRGRTIALIAETPDVFPMLTVREHLAYAAAITRRPDGWQSEADALLERLGLLGEADTLGHALSKGMRQKTLIAATVLGGAPVMLFDEPMIGLDPLGQRELRAILGDLRDLGHALLVSTHLLDQAASMADRLLVVDRGRLAASGTVEELRAQQGTESSLEDMFLAITSGT